MRKIGILTFHYSNNYGGVLQALSLQNVINSMGYDEIGRASCRERV